MNRPRGSAARRDLAAQQAQLLSALVAAGEPPPGFDPDRLRAQSDALLAKRRRVVGKLRPEVEELGGRLPELFEAYGRNNPRRIGTSARDDADSFVDWLRARKLVDRSKLWRLRRFLRWLTR